MSEEMIAEEMEEEMAKLDPLIRSSFSKGANLYG